MLAADGEQLIYGQGEGLLVIDPVDNLIVVTIYTNNTNSRTSNATTPMNLVEGFTEVIFKLTFGNTTDFICPNVTIANMTSLINGQILFRIQAKLILENSEHNFMITKVDPNLSETLMYTGTWLSSVDYQAANAAAAAATANAITAASLAAANAIIDEKNRLLTTLNTQKIAAETALATYLQGQANVGAGGVGGNDLAPTSLSPIDPDLGGGGSGSPVVILSYRNVQTEQTSTSTSGITIARGQQLEIVTNLPTDTVLTEIRLGINVISTYYQPIQAGGYTVFHVPAVFNVAGGGQLPANVSISITTADGQTASTATGPAFVTVN